jgi:hypothetical protein
MSVFRDSVLALVLSLSSFVSLAHGDWPPKHGGVVSQGGEYSVELVQEAAGLRLYLEDHGEPVPTAGASATMEITAASGTISVPLAGAGGNMFMASGIQLAPGDRVVVRGRLADNGYFVTRLVYRLAAPVSAPSLPTQPLGTGADSGAPGAESAAFNPYGTRMPSRQDGDTVTGRDDKGDLYAVVGLLGGVLVLAWGIVRWRS